MDITQLILADHEEQRRLFAILDEIPSDNHKALLAIWQRLRALLDVHAEAEERFFYPDLLKVGRGAADGGDAVDETKDAIKDHNEIRDAAKAVDECQVGSGEWIAAVAAANKANGDHTAEEERQGLADFRRHASLELRSRLGLAFAVFEADHLTGVPPINKSPRKYVKENT